jgi:hypothetical protein
MDAATLLEAGKLIDSCELCHPEYDEILLDVMSTLQLRSQRDGLHSRRPAESLRKAFPHGQLTTRLISFLRALALSQRAPLLALVLYIDNSCGCRER